MLVRAALDSDGLALPFRELVVKIVVPTLSRTRSDSFAPFEMPRDFLQVSSAPHSLCALTAASPGRALLWTGVVL